MRFGIRCLVIICAVLLASATARAEQLGPVFNVHTAPKSPEFYPDLGAHPDGKFIAAWQVKTPKPPEKASRILVQRFKKTGLKRGTPITVTKSGKFVRDPSVDYLDDDRFVVVWVSLKGKRGNQEIVQGRVFKKKGTPIGPKFTVTEKSSKTMGDVTVEALPNGRFVVLWKAGKEKELAILGQIYSKNGTARGGNFIAAKSVGSRSLGPSVASVGQKSKFVVVFENTTDGSLSGQILNRDGSPFGGVFQLNENSTTGGHSPDVSALGPDTFIVAWAGEGIRTRIFQSDGSPAGPSKIAVDPADSGAPVSIAGLSDGDAIVAWIRNSNHSLYRSDIRLRRVDGSGDPVGDAYTLAGGRKAEDPSVAGLNNGRYVVIWGDGAPLSIHGRMSE